MIKMLVVEMITRNNENSVRAVIKIPTKAVKQKTKYR